ncbi:MULTISPECIES: sugar phosphate isomerase/epimerase family protein [Paenarthrobacter]|jgi:sugar phosphate isomerase/epimerase|uniref:sugar phosphate isomerase/epimerase family protein n=1 Tax=Paenarthrobacter TaxID=1742992 RepID=UPI00140C213F|nr:MULTISPECIES: sugar phosphate isomerase/epimerase [Paenarthrobacter]MCX8455840.1 sugar phosphate isomerase/epimerase [Paenarthrobacter ureafaciens]MCY0973976.1 sugar phosphate isomerase/epimerase [Paenarthrobacter ureafaciens]QOT15927.1 sugar phosphate isomerase/epimerase [Paenarthrobacter sp. YJN-5]QQQ61769.1 sugar phosphate isomerase/epimerase [Paenarthrobacter ureafaciens]
MTTDVEPSENHRRIPVALSSASVYPLSVHDAFAVAQDLGYDGVEVMVTNNAVSQNPGALIQLSHRYNQEIVSIHAPTLLLTQQVWGTAWNKIERSCQMAKEVGCDTVVVHPPFRWQSNYAENFVEGVREISAMYQVHIAVENMYPWRVRGREAVAYLPHWDPMEGDYDAVTWDFSHAATAGANSLEAVKALGSKLRHVHLTDGSGSGKDEHLVPGTGTQQCADVLQHLASNGFAGAVVAEISTRKAKVTGEREEMLAETLRFARQHLAAPVRSLEG